MRSMIVGTVLALATLFAVPAMAGDKHDKASYPMPAAAFKQKVEARETKAREHMEKRASKLSAADAKELRAKFDAGIVKVNAEVSKATADGSVTKDEAKAVRHVAKELRGGRGHHGTRKHGHGKK